MIGIETLIQKINTLIGSGTLTENEMIQLSGAVNALENYGVSKVSTTADLPNPVTNKGRFLFIENENKYVFSNGTEWNINNIINRTGIKLYASGSNSSGQLGNNTVVAQSSPVSVVGTIVDWVQLSVGYAHNLGIRSNGTAWAWGNNAFGQLGDNTIINKSSPVSVVGGFTDWTQLSASRNHSLGLRANGTVWAWGNNNNGQLGDVTLVAKSSPISVVGGFTDWTQISSNTHRSFGLRSNGTIWSWGSNFSGALGDGTAINKSSPVSVVGGFTDWVRVDAGRECVFGIRTNGTAWGWGANDSSKLGNGGTLSTSSPTSVLGGFTDWVQVSGGRFHSHGLRANGTLWSWGNGSFGALGNGQASGSALSPVSVTGGFTDWTWVGTASNSIALRSNGTLWTWGYFTPGGTIPNPFQITNTFSDWYTVSSFTGYGAHIIGLRM